MNPVLIAAGVAAAAIAAGAAIEFMRSLNSTSSLPATPPAGNVAACPLTMGAMTPARAQQYMDDFKKTDIPFDFPPDCCYSRARVMCDEMEKDGIICQKYWYGGELHPMNADGSVVSFPNPSFPVEWGYHVAPLVQVQQADGTTQAMILDPSLSDKPLTVAEWEARCNHVGSSAPVRMTTDSAADYPLDGRVRPPYSVTQANRRMETHKRSREFSRAHNVQVVF